MNCFMASFALGDRAVLTAQAANLPKPILQLISKPKRYPEGTAVCLDIHTPKDLDPIKTLVKRKLEN